MNYAAINDRAAGSKGNGGLPWLVGNGLWSPNRGLDRFLFRTSEYSTETMVETYILLILARFSPDHKLKKRSPSGGLF